MEMLTGPPGWLPKALRVMSPAVRPVYERFFTGGMVLAAIMEDLPYLDGVSFFSWVTSMIFQTSQII
jgi:hypothetical protein